MSEETKGKDENLIQIVKDGFEKAEEALEKRMSAVKTDVDEKIEEVEKALEKATKKLKEQERISGDVEESTKKMISALEKQYTSLKDRQDAFEIEGRRLRRGQSQQGFKAKLKEVLIENKDAIVNYGSNRRPMNFSLGDYGPSDMDMKATMLTGTHTDGTVVQPTLVPGVKFDPDRRTHIRQFIPQGSTSSNAIWYIEETEYNDEMGNVAEGALKPESDLTLTQQQSPVVKIATHFDVSEEMLNDIDYLSSHISLRGTEKYFVKEDNDLLYGTGTGNQLTGLTVSSTGYQLGQYEDENAQEYDIILQSIKQLMNQNYQPTAALVSITSYFNMIQRKDQDGKYIVLGQAASNPAFGNQQVTALGVPIIPTNALQGTDFLIADFPMLTTLFDRQGVNVRFYDQNEDNAVNNLVTVVIEARLALPTYLPNAGRYGNFEAAIADAEPTP